jgi:hypothetical protein
MQKTFYMQYSAALRLSNKYYKNTTACVVAEKQIKEEIGLCRLMRALTPKFIKVRGRLSWNEKTLRGETERGMVLKW